MKKNAFTLIELIATIGLLGMLATITITISVRKINETKEKSRDTMIESIELAAKQYVTDKGSEILEFNNNDNAYISLQTLVEKEYFTESLIDPTTKKSLPLTNEVYVTREESGEIISTYDINQRQKSKLTLIGSYNEYVEEGKEYVEKGVIAINTNKQDVSENVTISGTVDTTTPDTYKITYELDNVTITRNVIVYSTNLGTKEYYKFTIDLDGGIDNRDYLTKYEAGTKIELEEPTKEGYIFKGWSVKGIGASINGNTLTTGSAPIEIKALWKPYATTYITNLLKKESTLKNGLINQKVTYEETTYDAGIRYSGEMSEVKNKVYYNCDDTDANGVSYGGTNYDYASSCEVWRIIGVFDTKTSTSGNAEKRVKLINTNSTFTASWDSSANGANSGYGINQWGESGDYDGADLKQLLNGFYIGENSTCTYCNGIGQETCSNTCTAESLKAANMKVLTTGALGMISNAVWDTYGVKWPDEGSTDSSWAPIAYLEEKGISAQNDGKNLCVAAGDPYGYCNDSVTRTTNWTGLVGLMSVSDITYADGWLYNQSDNSVYPWSISPCAFSGYASGVWYALGGFFDDTDTRYQLGVFASVYLNSDIQIIDGDGNNNPYILAI